MRILSFCCNGLAWSGLLTLMSLTACAKETPRTTKLDPSTATLDAAAPDLTEALIPVVDDPHRQFDFWLGEWDVHNSHLNADGTWRPGGKARALIQSVAGGRAVLEQWNGVGDLKLRGFSIRAYDTRQKKWIIILNWHSGGNPSQFSPMVGEFADDRGEFFPPRGPKRLRYTFSEARANSCQWDMAQSRDGRNWRTEWIMRFTRREPRSSVNASNAVVRQPPEKAMGRLPRLRQLDGLIGNWQGTAQRRLDDGTWQTGSASRSVSSMIDGYGLLQFSDYEWKETGFSAIAFNTQRDAWTSVGLSDHSTGFHWLAGKQNDDALQLSEIDPARTLQRRERWSEMKGDSFHWERDESTDGGKTWQTVLKVDFQRDQS